MKTSGVLENYYSNLFALRAPVVPTCNKAGANYKSEVPHETYSPRGALEEWLSIADAILDAGCDAVVLPEESDDAYLDCDGLEVDQEGQIFRTYSKEGARARTENTAVGHMKTVMTGRVFTANGPWVVVEQDEIRVILPHMLPHRRNEQAYYVSLIQMITPERANLQWFHSPHRWEGMADVMVTGNKVVVTHTVAGHYDALTDPKTPRSSKEGVTFAALAAGVKLDQLVYAELVYPHFHGDTVHFALRTGDKTLPCVFQDGLYKSGEGPFATYLTENSPLAISKADAQDAYASNSRQAGNTLLTTSLASDAFVKQIEDRGLKTKRLTLHELFGKAGGGPACATLYLPKNLPVSETHPLRYSQSRPYWHNRLVRTPKTLRVDPGYFAGKTRG